MSKKRLSNKVVAGAWGIVACVLVVALGIGNYAALAYSSIISSFLQQDTYRVEEAEGEDVDTEYFKSEFSDDESLLQASEELAGQIQAEGMVLIKNDDAALPLGSGTRVSLFSESSVDMIYGGTGSGAIDTSQVSTLRDALEGEGVEVNPALWDFYESNHDEYSRVIPSNLPGFEHVYHVNEAPVSTYTQEVLDSFSSWSDAAVVVISRSGGEGLDLITDSSAPNGNYLALTDEELQIFDLLEQSDAFDRVIVLLNTSNPMELGFMENYSKVKSCLWVGNVGQLGITQVAKALTGEVNPSGRLVDTYASDAFSAPAMANFGEGNVFTNGDEIPDITSRAGSEPSDIYVTYAEGIYVGYRYYETRYEDVVLGQGNAGSFDYASEVLYPFGHGLSYTTFEQDDFEVSPADDGFEVSVRVTNTGNVAGKEVVQVYLQSPYTDYDRENGVEKSAVQLAAFDKTDELAPGESQVLTMSVSRDALKAYDANNAKTYVVDAGDYYLALGNDAHDALNNILAAKGLGVSDGMTEEGDASLAWLHHEDSFNDSEFATSEAGAEITNQFDDVSPTYYEGSVDEGFTYLSRSDWEGTFPERVVLTATDQMIDEMTATGMEDDPEAQMPTTGADNGLQLIDLRGADYDDPAWEDLLDQMSAEEMSELVRVGGYGTVAVSSVGKPATVDRDGPQGISGTIGTTTGLGVRTVSYSGENVMGSTWNRELLRRTGEIVGESGLHMGVTGWYAPGMNIHRTPFSGRNFEYYAEDPFLSAELAVKEVAGAETKGIFAYVKHFALNDQDAHRYGLSTYANEQAIREIYLYPFEHAVKDGGASSVMTSYNRLGTRWAGADVDLITDVLRGEWGFVGNVITDWAAMDFMDLGQGLTAGNDQWLNTGADLFQIEGYENNATVMQALRKASKNILFTVANSAAMNGISSSTRIVKITPTWQYWLYGLDVVVALGVVAGTAAVVKRCRKGAQE